MKEFFNHISRELAWSVTGILLILIIASVIVLILTSLQANKDFKELKQRVSSWWIMCIVFFGALLVGKKLSLFFFALISFLALKEFFTMIRTRRADRRVLFWAYLTIPIQYYLVGIAWYGMFIIFIPVYFFLLVPLRLVIVGETKGFVRSAGVVHWGTMLTVFCLSHVAYLLVLPNEINPNGGTATLVIFMAFLNQFNDVCQFIFGKLLGKRKIVPSVSPGKTWAGFIGGVTTTVMLSVLLSRWITPFNLWQAILAGIILGVGGFLGDVIISAIKRDVGVKDSGQLLPGHGGILDRIDSLVFVAPLFFHFVRYLHA